MAKLAKIIEYRDTDGDMMAVRLPSTGDGIIEWGSQLIVREGQVALFFRDGKPMARFDSGRYVLTTQQVPVLTKFLSGMAYGRGNSPFRAEVYFVGLHLFKNLRWGTPEPVYIPDPILMQIPVRAHGRFAVRVADPTIFVPRLVGTRGAYRKSDIEDFLRSQYLVPALTDAIASLQRTFQELPRFLRELGIGVRAVLAPEFSSIGLELSELSVASVSTTEEIQATLNRNAAIASEAHARARGTQYELEAKAIGARALAEAGTSYQQVGMTDAMGNLASNPGTGDGGGGGNPMNTGVGLGLAMMMPQMMSGMMRDPALNPAGAMHVGTGVAHAAGSNSTGAMDPMGAVARLKALKELLDAGIISQADFDARKDEFMKAILGLV